MGETSHFSLKMLGRNLRKQRERVHESLAEVSGAVEIDQEVLAQIERGDKRPSEDILLLLISHLDIAETEALKLWELAGFEAPSSERSEPSPEELLAKQLIMVVSPESKVLHSDDVTVQVTRAGLTLHVGQEAKDGTLNTVARVALNRDQAHKLVQDLAKTLYLKPVLPKQLPSPRTIDQNK